MCHRDIISNFGNHRFPAQTATPTPTTEDINDKGLEELQKLIRFKCNEAELVTLCEFIDFCISGDLPYNAVNTAAGFAQSSRPNFATDLQIQSAIHPAHQIRFSGAVRDLFVTVDCVEREALSQRILDLPVFAAYALPADAPDFNPYPSTHEWLDNSDARNTLKTTLTSYLPKLSSKGKDAKLWSRVKEIIGNLETLLGRPKKVCLNHSLLRNRYQQPPQMLISVYDVSSQSVEFIRTTRKISHWITEHGAHCVYDFLRTKGDAKRDLLLTDGLKSMPYYEDPTVVFSDEGIPPPTEMAILKLYGAKAATCTRRVATILHELKVPFEMIEVDYKAGEHKRPEFLEKQPFGQVPYLDDDGFILYESRAICRYIAAKYPESGLIPAEPKANANATFEQAASVELTNFEPSASKAGLHLYMKKQGLPFDQALVDEQIPILDKKLDGYELILGQHRYLAGDKLTLADLFHLPYAPFVALGGADIFTRRPNVARWYNELVTRPSWLAYEGGVVTTTAY